MMESVSAERFPHIFEIKEAIMAINHNPSAKAGERESFESLYHRASEGLVQLFGSDKVAGIFQQEPLPDGFMSRTQFVRSIMDAPGNSEFFKSLPQPFVNVLATVMAARGNPNFPPDLAVEFTFKSSPDEEEDEEFTKDNRMENRIENLRALAEIYRVTDGQVALRLPFNGRLDFQGSVIGIFMALTDTQKASLQLGGEERKHSSDLLEALREIQPRTPVQRLSARASRWAERREATYAESKWRETRAVGPTEDAAAALPAATPAKPEASRAPAIPDLSALTGGKPSTQPPAPPKAAPERKKAVVVPVTATAPTIAPPAEKPKPAAAVADEDRELILEAIKAAGTPAARAMLALVRGGKKTVAEAAVWATSKGLF